MNFLEKINYDWIGFLNFNERPFRAKFVPKKVYSDLDRYKNNSRGLVNYFKKWRTKVEFVKPLSKKRSDFVAVGGEYDFYTDQCVMIVCSDKFDQHKFTDQSWDRFKQMIIQTLMHELIHFMQYQRRDGNFSSYYLKYKKSENKKTLEDQEYLSCFDEIQAYAHDCYVEIRCIKPSFNFDSLTINSTKGAKLGISMEYYLKTFQYTTSDNKVISKLFDQIKKWDRKYNKWLT